MPIGDRIVSGLGFDVEEDDYRNNETFTEMILKFGNRNRKTPLKRYYILDNIRGTGFVVSVPL